jgi:hypothetical protein
MTVPQKTKQITKKTSISSGSHLLAMPEMTTCTTPNRRSEVFTDESYPSGSFQSATIEKPVKLAKRPTTTKHNKKLFA